jgi:hypothetical protein
MSPGEPASHTSLQSQASTSSRPGPSLFHATRAHPKGGGDTNQRAAHTPLDRAQGQRDNSLRCSSLTWCSLKTHQPPGRKQPALTAAPLPKMPYRLPRLRTTYRSPLPRPAQNNDTHACSVAHKASTKQVHTPHGTRHPRQHSQVRADTTGLVLPQRQPSGVPSRAQPCRPPCELSPREM